MEIIRHRNGKYKGIPPETVDDESMTLVALGMLTIFLRYQGTDEVTPSSVASQNGMGPKTRVRTMSILLEGGYIASFRVQNSNGSWGAKMIVSEVPMSPDEVKAHMETLVRRDNILSVQLMHADWKSVPGMSRRKPKSPMASA